MNYNLKRYKVTFAFGAFGCTHCEFVYAESTTEAMDFVQRGYPQATIRNAYLA